MPFVSYAQNLEDVMLKRALADVGRGFYVDLGAADPDEYSVTKAFYDLGWRGINVEPMQMPFERLVAARSRDVNLSCVVGAGRHPITMFSVDGVGGLSTADQRIAESYRNRGIEVVEVELACRSLDDILDEHASADIHFLKIDVEGYEQCVLDSASFTRHRPWIVLVEATLPLTSIPSYSSWEPGLLAKGYVHVYSDGLNRFYLASEKHAELHERFAFPPNVFDEYEVARVHQLEVALHDAVLRLDEETSRFADQHALQSAQVRELTLRLLETARQLVAR